MFKPTGARRLAAAFLGVLLLAGTVPASAADQELLEILLGNGIITQDQYDRLMEKDRLTAGDLLGSDAEAEAEAPPPPAPTPPVPPAAEPGDDDLDGRIRDKVAEAIENEFPVKASYGSKGFRLETRDGNWQTNLQWRAQLRYLSSFLGDPRQLDDFEDPKNNTFEARRLRMKIGGHGYRPWLKYYFEVDLQPSRDFDDDGASASARVIDWRIDVAKYDWASLRVGQWKIDHNRERVDSSGRQQFVERSIANRVFTIDRQVGAQLRGHLFQGTPADMRYYLGVFTGEGRGVRGDDDNLMYQGRLQWNFLGRDLPWKQTDVEYTEQLAGSLAFGAVTTRGRCTRWSSSGCGNLDGFAKPADTADEQFDIDQYVQEFAFKWRGFSAQQEMHWKDVKDRAAGTKSELMGGYAQAGYFFHHLLPAVPEPLELAFRYAFVEEPNEMDRSLENDREEFTAGANWFFAGHNNKLTLDVSHLTLDDAFFGADASDERVRLQWDVSF